MDWSSEIVSEYTYVPSLRPLLALGTWEPVVPMLRKKLKWEDPIRVRVPMRGTGADQLVVVLKSLNGDGAKGWIICPYCLVNQRWEEPRGKVKPLDSKPAVGVLRAG